MQIPPRHISSLYLGCLVTCVTFSIGTAAMAADRYLIIHADDAGMSHSVNMATIEALESGVVSSASIMVPCPWFKEFAEYAKGHPEYDYGIHLTLNSEWDVYRWGSVAPRDQVRSLLDDEGYLWDSVAQVREHARAEEVEIELRAQIDRARGWGIPLTHLDTHMGALVSRPDLVEVYVKLGVEYDLPILFFKRLDQATSEAYPALAEKFATSLSRLREKDLPSIDTLLQFYGGDIPALREQEYRDQLANLPVGVTELIIHCGFDNEELRGITSSAARRDQDRRLFSNRALLEELRQQGVQLITWKQLRQLRRP